MTQARAMEREAGQGNAHRTRHDWRPVRVTAVVEGRRLVEYRIEACAGCGARRRTGPPANADGARVVLFSEPDPLPETCGPG